MAFIEAKFNNKMWHSQQFIGKKLKHQNLNPQVEMRTLTLILFNKN